MRSATKMNASDLRPSKKVCNVCVPMADSNPGPSLVIQNGLAARRASTPTHACDGDDGGVRCLKRKAKRIVVLEDPNGKRLHHQLES